MRKEGWKIILIIYLSYVSASFPYCQYLRFPPLLSMSPLPSLTVNASASLPYSLPSFMINASAATPLLAFPLPPLETRHWFIEGLWKHLCQWEKNEQRFRVTKRRNTHHQCICFSQIKREQTQFYHKNLQFFLVSKNNKCQCMMNCSYKSNFKHLSWSIFLLSYFIK